MDIEKQTIILEHFSDYLKQNQNIEILFSEKFGYIYITLWGTGRMHSYDAIQIESAEHLCDILMDMLVFEHMSKMEQHCMLEEEARAFYYETIKPYVLQLPNCQESLKRGYAKIVIPLICKNN